MKKIFHIFTTAVIMSVLIFTTDNVLFAESSVELTLPIKLDSKDVLDIELLQGKNYTINAAVANDGIINTYHLFTDYGNFSVESTAALMIRINELNALSAMEELEKSGVFKDSLVAGVKAPIKGAAELVKSPVQTTKGFIKGTGKFLSNMGRAIVSSDPYQDNVLKVAIGYDAAKRAYAYEFGIDPYSEFEPVTEELGKIAQAAVAGGLVPRATMAVLDHDIVTVMRISAATKNLRKLVRDNSPGDLHKINKEKLEKLEIPSSQIESFLSNYGYSPQEKTLLIGFLELMSGVEGLDLFLAAADTAIESYHALLYRLVAQMMLGYHTRVNPVEQIIRIDGTPHLKTKSNTLILAVPADFIFKTSPVVKKITKIEEKMQSVSNIKGKELWITGNIDDAASKMFENNGWKIVVNSNRILDSE